VGTDAERIRGEKLGLQVVIDMAKLNIPFQFNCTVATRRTIRESPDLVQRLVRAMAEGIHYYKNNRDPVVKIMQKYTRGPSRTFFDEVYDSNKDLLVRDTYPTLEGLKNTLEIQASLDPKAAKAKAEDFVDLRFVDELKTSGFIEKLYGKR
jgi:ABC-type nitrate/sulfonate/bicarbonate transport system substrate-binding protein